MGGFLVRRAFGALQALILASMVSFIVLRLLPGDPARLIAGDLATPKVVASLRKQMGLDQNIFVQYWDYISGFVRGDWGYSYSTGEGVRQLMLQHLPATLELAVSAFLFAAIGALVVSVLATYLTGWFRGVAKTISLLGLGTPPFWLGLVLLLVFSYTFAILPGPNGRLSRFLTPPPNVTGFYTIDSLLSGNMVAFSDALAHLILPTIALGILPWAFLTRLLTANLDDTVDAPFVTVVRSKGVSAWATHLRHVLHNASLPTITTSPMVLGALITGSVVVENVFAWPGVGQLLSQAIQRKDFAIVQAFVLLAALFFIFANFAVDIINGFIDPRLRVTGSRR